VRTALDTNILSALLSNELPAQDISSRLSQAYSEGGLVICAPVHAELSAYPQAKPGFLDAFLEDVGVIVDFSLGEEVWRLAGKSFAAYAARRRRSGGGSPRRLLVDFVIAAHAVLNADQLMTLDAASYEQYFPQLRIIHSF
jgi:predicted nucleic acid-binding protein